MLQIHHAGLPLVGPTNRYMGSCRFGRCCQKPPVPLIVVLDNVWRCEDSVFDVGEIYRTVTALHFHFSPSLDDFHPFFQFCHDRRLRTSNPGDFRPILIPKLK